MVPRPLRVTPPLLVRLLPLSRILRLLFLYRCLLHLLSALPPLPVLWLSLLRLPLLVLPVLMSHLLLPFILALIPLLRLSRLPLPLPLVLFLPLLLLALQLFLTRFPPRP